MGSAATSVVDLSGPRAEALCLRSRAKVEECMQATDLASCADWMIKEPVSKEHSSLTTQP